jgi:head-tail adaptor
VRAGSLDRRVKILRRVLTHDGLQQVESWQLLGTRSASRMPVAGGERADADRRTSFPRYSLWMRIDSLTRSITSADAVGIDGQIYELLQPPLEVERSRRQGIELLVEGTGTAAPA